MKNSLEPVWKEHWEAVVEDAMDQTLDLDMWGKLLISILLFVLMLQVGQGPRWGRRVHGTGKHSHFKVD